MEPEPNEIERSAGILPVLIFATLVMSIVQTLGAPMVSIIAEDHGVSLEVAQWVLTSTLTVGAVTTPLSARLADGRYRKPTMLVTIGAVAVGSASAALATTFWMAILGRALQGIGMAITPMTISAARDLLPENRMRKGVRLLAVSTSIGTGLGYPITGVIADAISYRAAYWTGGIVALIAFAMVWLVIPGGSPHRPRHLDWHGALLMGGALLGVLLAISQGRTWGWTSAATLGSLATGLVLVAAWILWELRVTDPLVDLRLAIVPSVMRANVTAMMMGIALFSTFSLVNRYAQAPASAGYGFDAGLLETGLIMAPIALGSLASNRALHVLMTKYGPATVLSIGATITVLDGMYLACFRPSALAVASGVFLAGFGTSLAFAAMPALIFRAVPPDETGSASGLNSVLRSVGGAIGSAASIAVLSLTIPAGDTLPTANGYTMAFLVISAAGALSIAAGSIFRRWETRSDA